VEIAEGRDIDVLEIDAATHTQVDKVRDIIVAGLGIAPVRNRYKIFIIDEVHRLSGQAFDALLKSVEEPPPHVIFMMATTELEKVPQTIQSRSQVFELRTIGLRAIVDQLRRIADAEGLQVDDGALMLLARAADGSMRDAQSALDQVIAFAGETITSDDVGTVLGLVRRDLVLDIVEAVGREEASAVFDLAGRAVEAGYDLRLVCRELSRAVRDLMVIAIDPARLADPEIAAEQERERLKALAALFSPEDCMRAFDVLTKAEVEIRGAAQPRYQLEMALVRWIHLRKLVPLGEIIDGLEKGRVPALSTPEPGRPKAAAPVASAADRGVPRAAAAAAVAEPPPPEPEKREAATPPPGDFKDALLAEVRRTKKFFYNTVVAQAQKIEIAGERITFTFAPAHRVLRTQLEQSRSWLEPLAGQLAGRKITVVALEANGASGSAAPAAPPPAQESSAPPPPDRQAALKAKALSDSGVQAMLDVFAAEIKEVEEM
jgi:DNA polymerase-3 subunit gamma/tau